MHVVSGLFFTLSDHKLNKVCVNRCTGRCTDAYCTVFLLLNGVWSSDANHV